MSATDEIEEKGINIEKLSSEEKQTYFTMLDAVRESQLSVEKLRDYIITMRDAVENELTKTDLTASQDLFLKARLKNYMLLESFLISPERAQKAYDEAVARIRERVK